MTGRPKYPRVGPTMAAAVDYVRRCGGVVPSMMPIADHCGPNGSRRYGYAAVRRAIAVGLLKLDPSHPEASPKGKGAVVLTDEARWTGR